MINPNKNNKITSKDNNDLEEMEKSINGIMNELLDKNLSNSDINNLCDLVNDYVNKYDRILYSAITYKCFSMFEENAFNASEELPERLNINIKNVYKYIIENKKSKKIKITIIKIYDHINLAMKQYLLLNQTDCEYKDKLENFIEPYYNKIDDKVENAARDTNNQLLALLSIFTALAFLLFGGISSLENIFTDMSVSIFKLIIIGSIWGIAILNIIFIFLMCVCKIMNFHKTSTENSSDLFARYPVFWWSNFIIISITLLSGSIYYFKNRNSQSVLLDIINACPSISIIILIAIMIFSTKFLYNKTMR